MRLRIWVFSISCLVAIATRSAFAQAPAPGGKTQSPPPSVRQPPVPQTPAPAKNLEATKRAKVADPVLSGAYGSVEMLHIANRNEDREDHVRRQQAFGQFRLILGYQTVSGLDLYGTLGATKLPNSQQLVARRPELEADFHLTRTSSYDFLGYAINKLPWSEDPLDHELSLPQTHGSETTVGIKGTFSNQMMTNLVPLTILGGADVWTKMYSRQQYATEKNHETEELTLVQNSRGEPIEDNQQHLFSEFHLGFGRALTSLPEFSSDITAFLRRDFEPNFRESEESEPTYSVQKTSYYRVRLNYRFSKTIEVSDEFFHFHRGFFEARTPDYDRRYRNLAKLTYKF